MKGIYLKDYNIALQFTNKSGSLVMLNTIILFCKYNNIPFEYLNIKINYKSLKTKFYIFTRNPLNRFITSYNWFINSDNANVYEIKTKYNIDSIEKFIEYYSNIMLEINDSHYIPQILDILEYEKQAFKLTSYNIKNKLKDKFHNYQFVKMETIGQYDTNFKMSYQYVNGVQDTTDTKLFEHDYSNTFILNLFKEFDSIEYNTKTHFNLLYNSIKTILDIRHHKSNNRLELLDKVANVKFNIFDIENVLYGYSLSKSII